MYLNLVRVAGERLCTTMTRTDRHGRQLTSVLQDHFRQRAIGSTMLTAAVRLFVTVGAALAVTLLILRPMWVGPIAESPASVELPGSGVNSRTEVTAIWIPRSLLDLARDQAGSSVHSSPEELQTYLEQQGWRTAWYALTYRAHQVDGRFAEITQIRLLTEAAEHLDEFQAVMTAAARRPTRLEGWDRSRANVVVIPDAFQCVDPREAITALMTPRVAGEKNSPSGGIQTTLRTD
jgi:hypothetical protein